MLEKNAAGSQVPCPMSLRPQVPGSPVSVPMPHPQLSLSREMCIRRIGSIIVSRCPVLQMRPTHLPASCCVFSFLRKLHTALHSCCANLHSQTVHESSLFSTSLSKLVICCLFDSSHSDKCEVISLCGFDLHFPDD